MEVVCKWLIAVPGCEKRASSPFTIPRSCDPKEVKNAGDRVTSPDA